MKSPSRKVFHEAEPPRVRDRGVHQVCVGGGARSTAREAGVGWGTIRLEGGGGKEIGESPAAMLVLHPGARWRRLRGVGA
jgi:hypothetical protein